ncbi:MFS transporter [Streptomyces sp. NBC_01518]|uniref:MFS transporter n=1 Tax=Streptomyces sp. NBC_01518 TaxID=2903891 RepID=UPI00386DC1DF
MPTTEPAAVEAQPSLISADSRPRLPLLHRAVYGLGDFAGGMIWNTTIAYLAIFYTDTVGIAAGAVGILMVGARVLDAVIDPVIGALAERTHSRNGRFRPWMLYGMFPLAAFSVPVFTAPFSGNSAAAVAWATLTYMILGILYSAVNVPYGALGAAMAETPADRTSLSSFRYIGSNAIGILLGLITVPLITFFSRSQDGDSATAGGCTITLAIFAAVSLPLLYAVFATSRETITPVRPKQPPIRVTMRAVLTNRPLMVFLVATLLIVISYFGRMGVVIYFYEYNVGDSALLPLLMSLTWFAAMIGTFAFTRFARHLGKRNMLIVSLVVQVLALVALYLVDPHSTSLVVLFTALHGLAGFSMALLISMIADVIDHGEQQTGIRSDGTIYAVWSFGTKLASAVSAAGVGLLGLLGYRPNSAQTSEALGGISFVVNLLPALVGVAAILVLLGYKLTDRDAVNVRNELSSAARAAREAR